MIPFVINIVYFMLSLALLFAFIRLTRGPSLPDRVVALELVASIVVGYVGVHAIDTGVSSLLDVAIVIALTAFLAAIGFARFLERGGRRND
ncbi:MULTISPECIES: monovalent cation/H+ antiporter complex subunit F [Marinobacter]|uniref:pH regulation protein F n=1 Tax=Marinobacter panjinensis TaxID=2576384 RepID=A0A4U6R2U9_9GAMM|nr:MULTISPECIES: monovalent cation/H+ antiporter complex subunit F [Marinobacter]MDX1552788.1 monovalent cation/H+ antiporter complex subunit F [Marinobacter sp.]MBL3555115.1 pH regulation protein F [Marinobacter sp. JB05H06]MCR8913509.1 monovalent cation/H+ antiporter complex subunit F [Marinobacter panjinensis]MDK8463651.1 monovalent cation/H+ antiporter complex subunit F [Marinobacter sp. SS13-12]TKV67829.1 pH regulation protein F [Marinobacter panjinensis]